MQEHSPASKSYFTSLLTASRYQSPNSSLRSALSSPFSFSLKLNTVSFLASLSSTTLSSLPTSSFLPLCYSLYPCVHHLPQPFLSRTLLLKLLKMAKANTDHLTITQAINILLFLGISSSFPITSLLSAFLLSYDHSHTPGFPFRAFAQNSVFDSQAIQLYSGSGKASVLAKAPPRYF